MAKKITNTFTQRKMDNRILLFTSDIFKWTLFYFFRFFALCHPFSFAIFLWNLSSKHIHFSMMNIELLDRYYCHYICTSHKLMRCFIILFCVFVCKWSLYFVCHPLNALNSIFILGKSDINAFTNTKTHQKLYRILEWVWLYGQSDPKPNNVFNMMNIFSSWYMSS